VGVGEMTDLGPMVRTFSDRHEVVLKDTAPVRWELMDMSGRTVSRGTSTHVVTVGHDALRSGVYVLRLRQAEQHSVVKLLVL